MTTEAADLSCDVVVIGGSAAGLAGAVALARSLRSVVVIDDGAPRNAVSEHAHNVLGREGIAPLDLLEEGRREAEQYGVRFLGQRAVSAARDSEYLTVDLADGSVVRARRMLLATGLIDELPDVPGLRDFWGSSVLHCPYCHGWEVRGQRIGVLCVNLMSLHQALLFRQLSDTVTLFVQDLDIPDESKAEMEALGITTLPGKVRRVSGSDGNLQVEVGSTQVDVQALVVAPYFRARAELFTQLGGQIATQPNSTFIETDATGATNVPGIWAAGNVTDPSAMVSSSNGAGIRAGAAINADLVATDARAAAQRMRLPPTESDTR